MISEWVALRPCGVFVNLTILAVSGVVLVGERSRETELVTVGVSPLVDVAGSLDVRVAVRDVESPSIESMV